MKRSLIILIFFGIFSIVGCKNSEEKKMENPASENTTSEEQTSNKISTEDSSEENNSTNPTGVDAIKQRYASSISKKESGAYETSSFTYDCNGEKSGTVTFYLNDEGVQLIEHSYAEYSHHEATDQYFLKDGKPYFIFYTKTDWTFDADASEREDNTLDKVTENRYYIENNNLVQCLEKHFENGTAKDNAAISSLTPNKQIACQNLSTLMENFDNLYSRRGKKGSLSTCLD